MMRTVILAMLALGACTTVNVPKQEYDATAYNTWYSDIDSRLKALETRMTDQGNGLNQLRMQCAHCR